MRCRRAETRPLALPPRLRKDERKRRITRSQFDALPIRPGEEDQIRRLLRHAPIAISSQRFTDPHVKANALLQAHFSRRGVSGDLALDQAQVLSQATRLLQAAVDVIASSGWLSPAVAAMELSQMSVQGMWDRDSPLLQLPHIDRNKARVSIPRGTAGCERSCCRRRMMRLDAREQAGGGVGGVCWWENRVGIDR